MTRAKVVVDYMVDADDPAAVDAMVVESKYRIASRMQSQLEITGAEMEEQISWLKRYGYE